MTNNTIPNMPRELLERVCSASDECRDNPMALFSAAEELRALLSAPSPAGVDGLEVVSNWVLFDAEADKPYIKKMLPEGFLAFFDCEEDARRAKANNPGADYKRIDRVKAEDAQAIIDGLRGDLAVALKVPSVAAMRAYLDTECAKDNMRLGTERDQQAQRIGELEGLLLRVQVSLSLDDTEWGYSGAEKYKLLADIRAALSAGVGRVK